MGFGLKGGGLVSKCLRQNGVPGEFVVEGFFRGLQQFCGLRHAASGLAQGVFDDQLFRCVDLAGQVAG